MVTHAFNPSPQELEAGGPLVYGASSNSARATEKPILVGGGVYILHLHLLLLVFRPRQSHSRVLTGPMKRKEVSMV